MRNRAMEFLDQAYCLLDYPLNEAQARIYVQMAVAEVQELLDQIALYETATNSTSGALAADARQPIPALLRRVETWRPCLALPKGEEHV